MPILVWRLSLPDLMKFITPRKNSNKKWSSEKLKNWVFFWAGQKRALFQGTCLKRSLVLYRYLRLQGEEARIIFGIRTENGELKGHAWVVVKEKPVVEGEDLNYQVIYSYPEPKAPLGKELSQLKKIMD